MKPSITFTLTVTLLPLEVVALPNPHAQPQRLLDKSIVPSRFTVTQHGIIDGVESTGVENTATYTIPKPWDEHPYWCSTEDYCNANWAPTVSEANALAQYLQGLGDQECVMQRPINSKDDGYTIMAYSNSHAKVGMFFTHLGDTDRVWKVAYPCWELGVLVGYMVEACQPRCNNGRVMGTVPIPNCWIKYMNFTGNQQNFPDSDGTHPGAGVGISPFP